MPYRRLPNTDQARINALKNAVENGHSFSSYNDQIISTKTLIEAENFLIRFEQARDYYKQCYNNQVTSSRKFQSSTKIARLYISHFIQVLNLAVIRSEIKPELKNLYGLEPGNFSVPDLTNDSSVIEWGDKIIKGEKERTRRGGSPIYNPTIAKVCVHYEIFKDGYEQQKNLQWQTSRSLELLSSLRGKADEIILDIWNQVEKYFENLSGTERLDTCRKYGVIYYYRTGEKKPQ